MENDNICIEKMKVCDADLTERLQNFNLPTIRSPHFSLPHGTFPLLNESCGHSNRMFVFPIVHKDTKATRHSFFPYLCHACRANTSAFLSSTDNLANLLLQHQFLGFAANRIKLAKSKLDNQQSPRKPKIFRLSTINFEPRYPLKTEPIQ